MLAKEENFVLVCLHGIVELFAFSIFAKFRFNLSATFEYANIYLGERLGFSVLLWRSLQNQQSQIC